MGMSSWILDRVDEFYEVAQKTISSCESFEEFQTEMKEHEGLLQGSFELEYLYNDNGYSELWNDYWSNFQDA